MIDALLSIVGGSGTVVMPAQSSDNSDPGQWRNPPVPNDWFETICREMPPFDKERTPTRGVGRIPELFRVYPKTRRSNHPQASFTANGKYSSQILETHVLTPAFGMDSPLGALYRLNAQALMIGVSYECCTALHLAEVLSGRTGTTRSGCAMIKDGKREWSLCLSFSNPKQEAAHRVPAELVHQVKVLLYSLVSGIQLYLEFMVVLL